MNKLSLVQKLFLQSALAASLVVSNPSMAATSSPAPAPTPAPTTIFVVNPDTLLTQVLKGNLALYQQFLSLESAKNSVNGARANLLPSLSLSGRNLASLIFGGAGFVLSEVQFLLPFLAPSNYFALDASENEFYANVIAYKILELNTYSSALSLYYTILADQQASTVYQAQAKNLNQIYQLYSFQNAMSGTVSSSDILLAQSAADTAQVQADTYTAKVATEVASLQEALGLPVGTTLQITAVDQPASIWESTVATDPVQLQKAIKQALSVSPEIQQLNYLIQAASDTAKQTDFGWIDSGTLSGVQNQNTGSTSTSSYTLGSGIDIGFGIFPEITAGSISEAQNQSQLLALQQADTATLQGTLPSVQLAVVDFVKAQQAEVNELAVYNTLLQDSQSGETNDNQTVTLAQALNEYTNYAQDSVDRITAEMNLNIQRVTLHRLMLTDRFATIQGCKATPQQASGGFWSIFSPTPMATLESLCLEGGSTQTN